MECYSFVKFPAIDTYTNAVQLATKLFPVEQLLISQIFIKE